MSSLKLDEPPEDAPQTKTKTTTRGRPTTATVKDRLENELKTRLEAAFIKIADALQNRGDDELGEAIREERKAMTGGFVSLTAHIPIFRTPLLIILNLVELVLAFGRVGGILLNRYIARRQRKMEEQQQAQAEYQAGQENPAYVTPFPEP